MVCDEPHRSGCCRRSRAWQFMLREPKLPGINRMAIFIAENTDKVVSGIDSCCTE